MARGGKSHVSVEVDADVKKLMASLQKTQESLKEISKRLDDNLRKSNQLEKRMTRMTQKGVPFDKRSRMQMSRFNKQFKDIRKQATPQSRKRTRGESDSKKTHWAIHAMRNLQQSSYALGGPGMLSSDVNRLRAAIDQGMKFYGFVRESRKVGFRSALTGESPSGRTRVGGRKGPSAKAPSKTVAQEFPSHINTGRGPQEMWNNFRSFIRASTISRQRGRNKTKPIRNSRAASNIPQGQGWEEALGMLAEQFIVGQASNLGSQVLFGKDENSPETTRKLSASFEKSIASGTRGLFKGEKRLSMGAPGAADDPIVKEAKGSKINLGDILGGIPSFQKGGTAKDTGLALLHKGEEIIPKDSTKNIVNNSGFQEMKSKSLGATDTKAGSQTISNDVSVAIESMNIYSPEDLEYEIQQLGAKLAAEVGKVS